MERQIVSKVHQIRAQVNRLQPQSAQTTSAVQPLVALQRSIGNQAVQRLIRSPDIQTKLQISTPDDPLEQEADRTAETVMRMPEPGVATRVQAKPLSTQIKRVAERDTEAPEEEEKVVAAKSKSHVPLAVREDDEEEDVPVQRVCADCEEEMLAQRLADEPREEEVINRKDGRATKSGQTQHTAAARPAVSNAAARNIHALNGGGSPLPAASRAFFEPRFGADLSHVRVHTDSQAADAAKSINAKAFTFGSNIAFGGGQYQPHSQGGQRLLAHELTHVIQQSGEMPVRGVSVAVAPSFISRSPAPDSGTQAMHEELIEQFRRAHGLPPRGIDPVTAQQVGPTDSEIRFGGLLEAWLRANRSQGQTPAQAPATTRGVPAPTRAPTIVGPGNTSVVAVCRGAPDVGACLQHRTYVENILPQAITNIRRVTSPYSAAIADLYTAALPAARSVAAPTPFGSPNARFGASVDAAGGPVTVTFGATTFTFTRFTISLQQQTGGANGQAFGAGGPLAFVSLNEASNDALLSNLPGIEATMVHETMHIFMEIIEGLNRGRTAGTPVDLNVDRTSYAALKTSLENALLPFITRIRQLPSFAGFPARGSTQQDAESTANSFLSETIARTEAGIFAKQRNGLAFVAADLRTLPPFFRSSDYWSPTPPVPQELKSFIQTNQAQIDAAIQPIIFQVGERYLNLRP